MPVTNLKPDNEDAENEEKLLANYNTKKKYRQVQKAFKFVTFARHTCFFIAKLNESMIRDALHQYTYLDICFNESTTNSIRALSYL